MREWPPITEPELLERLALDNEGFSAFFHELVAAFGPRTYEPKLLEHALAYPWERPARSYVLRDGEVTLLHDLDDTARQAVVDEFAQDRHPIVAFGSNASPARLELKFAHFPDLADRSALVLSGSLHDVDVGASASPTIYGAMPAALFPSPGTAVRAAVLWVTATQITQLTWSELSYRLGRLERAHFSADEDHLEVDQLFAYVSRLGAFCPDGEPLAMAAIPAEHRNAPARTQEQLLDAAAPLVLGDGAHAEDLVRAVFEDMANVVETASTTLWPLGRPLPPEHWTPFPT
jgi:hypothetical protein